MASQKQPVSSATAKVGDMATSTVSDAKDTAKQAIGQAKETLGQVADQAQQQAKSQFADQKDRVADGMNNVVQALRRTSEQLQDQDTNTGGVGDYVSKAAEKLAEITDHVRKSDLNELLQDAEHFARREPAIFLGSAFAIGVVAARFLKSSSQRQNTSTAPTYQSREYAPTYPRSYSSNASNGDWSRPYSDSSAATKSGTMPGSLADPTIEGMANDNGSISESNGRGMNR